MAFLIGDKTLHNIAHRHRIPFVLEADLQGQEARRETTDLERRSGIDFRRYGASSAVCRSLPHVRLGRLHHRYDRVAYSEPM